MEAYDFKQKNKSEFLWNNFQNLNGQIPPMMNLEENFQNSCSLIKNTKCEEEIFSDNYQILNNEPMTLTIIEEKIINSCQIIQQNNIEIFRKYFQNPNESILGRSLQNVKEILELNEENNNYNDAISFLTDLINFEMKGNLQKYFLSKICLCLAKGFLLDSRNYEIYLYEICNILLMSKNSREVLDFFLSHQPGKPLPSFEKMNVLE